MVNENQIEEVLDGLFGKMQFAAEPAGLYDPLRYMMGLGGKRVRPRLCLTVYSLYRDSFPEEILSPAAALEVFHSFTLIHDDIMDNAEMRRGKETVCRKWGGNTAILSGDVMSIESYRMISKAPVTVLPAVLDLFTATAAQVCEGQQYDMDFEQKPEVPMEDYMKMIGLKTAVLIACSAKMGALIAGADDRACDYFYRFGYDLGLAFQIRDDIFDYSPEMDTGKPAGVDVLEQKITLPLLGAFVYAGKEKEDAIRGKVGRIMENPERTREEILSFVRENKGMDYARKVLDSYIGKALDALKLLPESRDRDYLEELAHFVAERKS